MALQNFGNQEEFDRNYAGLYTLKLEKDALGRLGAQDGICMVCLKAKKLFPKLRPWEIHFCPRRFCEDCVHIPPKWSSPAEFPGSAHDCKYKYHTVCCWLCKNRRWDNINPLLGPENPQWSTQSGSFKASISQLRWQTYQRSSNSNKPPAIQDDGTPESDRQILKSLSLSPLKQDVNFAPLGVTEPPPTQNPDQPRVLHSPQSLEPQYLFDPLRAFQGACQCLLDSSPKPQNTMGSDSSNGALDPSSSNRQATAHSHPINPTTASSPSRAEIPQERGNLFYDHTRRRIWEQRMQMMREILSDENKYTTTIVQLKGRVVNQDDQLIQKQNNIKCLELALSARVKESEEALTAKAKESELRLAALAKESEDKLDTQSKQSEEKLAALAQESRDRATADRQRLDQLEAVVEEKDRANMEQKVESQQQLSELRSELQQSRKNLETTNLFNRLQEQTVQVVQADKKKLEDRVKTQRDDLERLQFLLKEREDKIGEQSIVVEQVYSLQASLRKKALAIQEQEATLESLQSENRLQIATIERLDREFATSELENLRSGKELERYQDALSSYDRIITKLADLDAEFHSDREQWETAANALTSDRDRLQRELADVKNEYHQCSSRCKELENALRILAQQLLPVFNTLNNGPQGSSIHTEEQTKDIQPLAERYQQLENAHVKLQALKFEADKAILGLRAENGKLQTALSQLRQRMQNGSETPRDTKNQEAEFNARCLAELQLENTRLEGEILLARRNLRYIASLFADGEWDPKDADLFAWIAGLPRDEDREMSEAPSC